jgi:hypothetical protein
MTYTQKDIIAKGGRNCVHIVKTFPQWKLNQIAILPAVYTNGNILEISIILDTNLTFRNVSLGNEHKSCLS